MNSRIVNLDKMNLRIGNSWVITFFCGVESRRKTAGIKGAAPALNTYYKYV